MICANHCIQTFYFIRRGKKLKLKLSVTNLTRLSHFMVLWIYPFSHLVQPLYWNMSSGKNYLRVSLQQKRADGNFVLRFPIVDIMVKQILRSCIFIYLTWPIFQIIGILAAIIFLSWCNVIENVLISTTTKNDIEKYLDSSHIINVGIRCYTII